jgi:type II secretion system protein N
VIRRRLAIVALVLAVFAVVGALTFPTEALLRRALGGLLLPAGLQLGFDTAVLRPSGLRLDGVHLVTPSDTAAFDAEWLRLRPSLLGLWRDRTGRPWSISASTCQGSIDLAIGVERAATPIVVTLQDVELAACVPYLLHQWQGYGRLAGTIGVQLVGPQDVAASDGALELRGAAWRPGGPFEDALLRADTGTLRWQLADRRLVITTLETASDDFRTTGHGSIRFVTPVDDSVLDLELVVTAGKTMPTILRRYFENIPGLPGDALGTRRFRVRGQLRDPRVTAVGAE